MTPLEFRGIHEQILCAYESARETTPAPMSLADLLREEIERHDGGSPHVNYCWWCGRDVNGKDSPAPQPHEPDCWYVRTLAALRAASPAGRSGETQ